MAQIQREIFHVGLPRSVTATPQSRAAERTLNCRTGQWRIYERLIRLGTSMAVSSRTLYSVTSSTRLY